MALAGADLDSDRLQHLRRVCDVRVSSQVHPLAQNMMVAAHGLELASCPVTLHHEDPVHELLGFPDNHQAPMAVGIGPFAPPSGRTHELAPGIPLRELVGLEPLAGLTAHEGATDLQCANPTRGSSMSYSLACGDVVEGCMTTLEAGSEDELMARVTDHARDEHGVTEISPELAGQVKGAIKTS